MFNIEVTFGYSGKPDEGEVADGVHSLLGAWVNNGQVLDAEYPLTFSRSACHAVVSCPERTSLQSKHGNKWVREGIADLRNRGLLKPKLRLLGRGLESRDPDRCKQPKWYVLIANFLSWESPLRCGEHYLPIPLYRLSATDAAGSNYQDVLCWQRLYRNFDSIQISCGAGERAAVRQMSDVRSPLSRQGRDVCRRIEDVCGTPTYYYLHRASGRSLTSERRRRCRSCGGEWLSDEPVHFFDFKCEECRLVSNIGWSVRE